MNMEPIEMKDLKKHFISAIGHIMFGAEIFQDQDDLFGKRNIKYRLSGTIIICENNCDQVVLIAVGKGLHVFYVGALETVNALIIIAHNKYIWLIPVIDQKFNHPVLRSACILVFVDQHVKKL